MIGTVVVLAGGIHVNIITVTAHVGSWITIPKIVISQLGMSVNDSLEGGHQRLVTLADGIGVIAVRDIGHCGHAH
jgi:hypothetical protein